MTEHNAKHLNPQQLVDEFKKSGEFDRLRRQLLAHFVSSDDIRPFMSRVEEIVQKKLSQDERLEHKSREAVHSEVMQDMERYPIVERAVGDLAIFKDESLLKSIEQYARNIVRGQSNENTKLWEAKTSRGRRRDEDEDNAGSSDYSEDEDPDEDEPIVNDANKKPIAASRSPETQPGNSTTANDVLQNGRSSMLVDSKLETKSAIVRSGTPSRTSPAKSNITPHTSSLDSHDDARQSRSVIHNVIDSGSRSPTSIPSSDNVLVNSLPVTHSRITTEGSKLASEEASSVNKEHDKEHDLPPGGESLASVHERIKDAESSNTTRPQPEGLAGTSHDEDLVMKSAGSGSGTLLSPLRSSSPKHSCSSLNSSRAPR